MGGLFRRPSIDTSAQNASLQRQEKLLRDQEERLAQRDAETALREESSRRVRAARTRGRVLLLGGDETGTTDQPMQTRLGG